MKRAFNALARAFAYFTVIPVGSREAPDADALVALPIIGAVVGAAAGAAGQAAALSGSSHAIAVALAFGTMIILTGALHLDGFLDCCDALFASVPARRRLDILKDPRCGSFAIAGFAVVVVSQLAALWSLPLTRLIALFAWCAALARWSALLNAFHAPDARAGEASRPLSRKPPWIPMAAEGCALIWFAAHMGTCAMIACTAVPLLSLAGGVWAKNRLGGGITGDVYGFLILISETAALLLCAGGV